MQVFFSNPDFRNSVSRFVFALAMLVSGYHEVYASPAKITELPEPIPAPVLEAQDLKGNERALSDFKGKIVLLNFWASWCPPCVHELPAMQRLKQKLGGEKFEVVALNVGEKKYKVWKFIKLIKFNPTVLLDPDKTTMSEWNVKTLPTSFLLDSEGRVRYLVRGDPNWDDEASIAVVRSLISETD
jgi:thiol-disulfide isomerase/thioredoxin